MRINTNFKELNFDERISIDKIANQPIFIEDVGQMTTKFGKKYYAMLDDGRWFYLTDTLEKIAEKYNTEHSGFECIIVKKTSKTGNTYWSTNLFTSQFETKTISDFIDKTIYIFHMETINTKYGEKLLITFSDKNGNIWQSFTSWVKLADLVSNDEIASDPLQVRVINKISKTGRTYVGYEDSDEDYDQIILNNILES